MVAHINPGDVISHSHMAIIEGVALQRGMNYRVRGGLSIFLMSLRKGAPYADQVQQNGEILIYEGHDAKKNVVPIPKAADQPMYSPKGKLTENGIFFEAAVKYREGNAPAELIKVYEKIKDGIWVYNGIFELVDAWQEKAENRQVFKFKLHITDESVEERKINDVEVADLEHNRMIPSSVKLEVWKRDKGRCVTCGATDNLHFDHILPFSKGGSSLTAENIQLLCMRHNLQKTNRIQ